MQHLQRIGGSAALALVVLFLITAAIFFILLPQLGADSIEDLRDPQIVLPRIAHSPGLAGLNLLKVPFFLCYLLLVFSLDERLRGHTPVLAQLAKFPGLLFTGLLLAVGLLRYWSLIQLSALFQTNPAQAATGYIAVTIVAEALEQSAIVALGAWLILTSIAGWRSAQLPRLLSGLGLVIGVVHSLCYLVFVPAFVDMPWLVWVGIVLLRRKNTSPSP